VDIISMDKLYGSQCERQRQRYSRMAEGFTTQFGVPPAAFISSPGRSELGGNHTDHQHGCVLTAAVDLDTVAAVRGLSEPRIEICSEGYASFSIDINGLVPDPQEAGRPASIARGVAAGFASRGYRTGGFAAYVVSDVLPGSGLSSSASFEVFVGAALSHLYNGNAIPAVELAKIGQYAENTFFGKPCGLQDQMACALGGVSYIDFADTAAPVYESIAFDLAAHGYALCITNTGGGHDGLTQEYAAITSEMGAVSQRLGQRWLRFCDESEFLSRLPEFRAACGDRAALRALHFFRENRRAAEMAALLKSGDFTAFLRAVSESGRSSWEYLQNVSVSGAPDTQPVAVGLALSERLLSECGAWRVHGGGFAGTIQAYVPSEMLTLYRNTMEAVFGAGCCYTLSFRPFGPAVINAEEVSVGG
jgi:galactokinase